MIITDSVSYQTIPSLNYNQSVYGGAVPGVDVQQGAENTIPASTAGTVGPSAPSNYISWLLRAQGSGNAYPGLPMFFSAANVGMFFPKYVDSATALSAPANRWFYGAVNQNSLGHAFPDIQSSFKAYFTDCVAVAQGTGTDQTITIDAGSFYPTYVGLLKQGSGTWWAPAISIAPQSNSWPITNGQVRVRMDNCFTTSGSSCVAGAYRIVICGYLNPPFPLVAKDVNCPAIGTAATDTYGTVNDQTPPYFRTIGAFQQGRNSGNYYCRPWGFYQYDTAGLAPIEGRLGIIFGQPLVVAGQKRALAAGDLCIRIVGIQAMPIEPDLTNWALQDTVTDAFTSSSNQKNTTVWGCTVTAWCDANWNFSNADGTGAIFKLYRHSTDKSLYMLRVMAGGLGVTYVYKSFRLQLTDRAAFLAKLKNTSEAASTKAAIMDWNAYPMDPNGAVNANNYRTTLYDTVSDRTNWPQQATLTGANLANVLECRNWYDGGGTNTSFELNGLRCYFDVILKVS